MGRQQGLTPATELQTGKTEVRILEDSPSPTALDTLCCLTSQLKLVPEHKCQR